MIDENALAAIQFETIKGCSRDRHDARTRKKTFAFNEHKQHGNKGVIPQVNKAVSSLRNWF